MGDPAPLRDVLCGVAMIQVCQQTGLSWRRSGPPWPRRLPTAGFPAPTAGTAGSPTSGERSPAASANWTICSARSAGKQRPHPAIVRRTQRCPTRGATQNHPICATTAGRKLRRRAEQIGDSARVIHSLCFPVGGRPASPRKSQTKSQRRPTSGDTQRRQATVKPGQVLTERHRATSSDAGNVTGGQGVAGSNPAVPTDGKTFSNIVTAHKSQQKSYILVQWPC